jgi:alkylation response protein AidB-like acyl-CoA dehydrogenase
VPIDQIVMGRGDGWQVANVTLRHERLMLGDPNKLMHRVRRVGVLMERTRIDGVRVIDLPEYRDRLVRLQAEVLVPLADVDPSQHPGRGLQGLWVASAAFDSWTASSARGPVGRSGAGHP